ncbi:hypothetical protein E0I00_23240 [Pseudomonas syringae pv. actinidiae]|nr:hypothetical protein [Pseudomonas syringae pv. actinidiae]
MSQGTFIGQKDAQTPSVRQGLIGTWLLLYKNTVIKNHRNADACVS